jgi:hypothetical protein
MLGFTGRAGVLDYYESVFRSSDDASYPEIARQNQTQANPKKQLPEGRWSGKGYLDWRTYQMSDHMPMWVQLKID